MLRAPGLFICGLILCALPVHAQLALAQRQVAAGQCSDAVANLGTLLHGKTKPEILAYQMLGYCYRELRQPEQAENAFREGLRIWPGSPPLERALGELLFQRQYDSSEAGALLERATRTMPRDPEAKHYYAQWASLNARDRICAKQEQEALALPGLNDLAALQMNTLLGMCSGRIEDEQGARAAFDRAATINNRQNSYDPVAAMEYVQFLIRYNDNQRAASVVDEILKRVPEFGPAHLQRARFLDQAGEQRRAVDEARNALASRGNDLNSERAAHVLLARCLSVLGQTADAETEQQWIRDHPNPETAHP